MHVVSVCSKWQAMRQGFCVAHGGTFASHSATTIAFLGASPTKSCLLPAVRMACYSRLPAFGVVVVTPEPKQSPPTATIPPARPRPAFSWPLGLKSGSSSTHSGVVPHVAN